ncbi:branched-chain amino acid ABC transporter permease [Hydrogenophaga sp.]|uniref:branched-chain amino acid ABC transporter permease n=1 Tax=Hydrogenophaga sp. TaxID=1904254 RepID=UPI0027254DCB|nr:branched-chain amino acid ABC transporter permease [Hydrogenophaga sp.]MDO9134296.1 branched-chain amino acid ABC transporter permease [Hydrogenophaga sp.]MDZ4279413.1 branched-chain amino acid ABC transporter permease [Hydrogenophaga sp.]
MNATSSTLLKSLLPFLALLALACLPWYASFATQRLLVEAFTLFVLATSWNLLAGYGGMVAIGHHLFVGVGAYALFALCTHTGLNPWLAWPVAGLVTAAVALMVAVPLLRLTGAYFAVATWVMAEMFRIGTLNTEWLGAGAGLPLTVMREFGRFERNAGVYWSALAIAFVALIAAHRMLRGSLGLALMSTRDARQAADANGVPVQRTRLTLWVVAATLTGLASGVAHMNILQVSPDASFSLHWTAAALFIVVLGGIGTLEGPILGVLVYMLLRENFAELGAWYFIGLGLLAMAVMVAAPGGLWGWLKGRGLPPVFHVRRPMPLATEPSPLQSPERKHLP